MQPLQLPAHTLVKWLIQSLALIFCLCILFYLPISLEKELNEFIKLPREFVHCALISSVPTRRRQHSMRDVAMNKADIIFY